MRFTVPGKPVSKQRPRMTRTGHTYTPKETVNYENLVKMCFREANGDDRFPDDTPICMQIYAYFEIPKSVSKKKRQQMVSGEIRPTKKPDVDNLAKSVCDALNGVAYRDDSAVTKLIVEKWYSEQPRVTVQMFEDTETKEGT